MCSLASPGLAHGQCLADVNGDGLLTPTDFNGWILAFNGRDLIADQNLDGVVSPADFSAWISNWNAGCRRLDVADLTLGGSASGSLVSTFQRDEYARLHDGGNAAPGEARFDEPILRIPVPVLDRPFTNVRTGALHLGAGYSESGMLVQFHALSSQGGTTEVLQASHGNDAGGDPAGPTPSNARRYALDITSTPTPNDWTSPTKDGDRMTPKAGEYFRGAWILVSYAWRSEASGVAISVGNYTPEAGLSGPGGQGDQLATVFCDLDMQTRVRTRVREWSTSTFVLRDENEVLFTAVDYSSGGSNESWAILVRATRPSAGSAWSFDPPVVVLERAGTNLVDHFHHFGLARNSTTGLATAFISTGDVYNDQAMYIRSIADLDSAAAYAGSYQYNGTLMPIAFADPPSARWNALDGWQAPTGGSVWTETRTIFGQRSEDPGNNGETWGAPQYVGCAPGPKRSQLLLGADVMLGHAVVCYDVDTFDALTETPYPEVWQRWGTSSQYGFGDNASGLNTFILHTPTPEAPEWYVGSLSQTNFKGASTPTTLIVGRATDDGRVTFAKAAQRVVLQTFAMTRDGKTIYMGTGPSSASPITRLRFLRAPELVRPRLLGAGFDQYQPLYAAGATPLDDGLEAGAEQFRNSQISQLESRSGIESRFATDEDLAALQAAGFSLPGYGPVYYVVTDGSETQAVYLSSPGSTTLPIVDEFVSPLGANTVATLPDSITNSEVLFAVLNDPNQPPRCMPWRFSFGDQEGTIPGVDHSAVAIEGGDWLVGRLPCRGNLMEGLRMRVSSTNGGPFNPRPGDVPVAFYMQIMGVTAGGDQMYPMGYAAPPNASQTTVGASIDSPAPMPNEVQRVTGLPAEGTVIFHGISDPHGVDAGYYTQPESQGVLVDHAFFSVSDGAQNWVEFGWRNGMTLYAKAWNGVDQPQFIDLFQSSYLLRQDDLKISMRYDSGSLVIDAWHNGNRTRRTITQDVPVFTSPVALCGDREQGRTIPMQVFSVSTTDELLSDSELYRILQTGEYAQSAP